MSTAPARPTSGRSGLHPLADVVLALLLLALDAGVALLTYLYALAQAGYAFFDAGADNSDVSMTAPAVALAVLGLAVLATALPAGRGRAIVTACGQTLAGLALLGIAAVALVLQYHDDHPPATEPGYSGPQTQCLSGGDNSECHGS
jgi:hypothetical protein